MGPQIRAWIFKMQNIKNMYHGEANKTTQKSSFGGIHIYIKTPQILNQTVQNKNKWRRREHRAKVSHYNNPR